MSPASSWPMTLLLIEITSVFEAAVLASSGLGLKSKPPPKIFHSIVSLGPMSCRVVELDEIGLPMMSGGESKFISAVLNGPVVFLAKIQGLVPPCGTVLGLVPEVALYW